MALSDARRPPLTTGPTYIAADLRRTPLPPKRPWWRTVLRFLSHPLRDPRLLLLVGSLTTIVVVIASGLTYAVFANSLASPESIINRKNSGVIFYDASGAEFYRTAGARDTTIIKLSDIDDDLEHATVAIEDRNFYRHGGFSIASIARAVLTNIRLGDSTAFGGSTITQQLVKNALLTQEKSYIRKFQELVLSIEIDRRYSKDQILELYLTSTYYGSNAYGVREAANVYFNQPVNDLTPAQAALIAGLPQAPSTYSPLDGDAELAKQRQAQVLRSMAEEGYLTETEAAAATAAALEYRSGAATATSEQAPHFVEYVQARLAEEFGEEESVRAGYKVYTTLDAGLQRSAQSIVARRVAALRAARTGATNGAVVAIEPETGKLLAMVGSADYDNDEINGKVNMATAMDRQPGSATKPFAYLQAFEDGVATPATTYVDKPTDYGGYQPRNADGRFRGSVSVRRALANSLNIPAVEAVQDIGVGEFVRTMNAFGVPTVTAADGTRCGLAIVLGCAEMSLVDVGHAYATLANEGVRQDISAYTRIVDKNGVQVYPKTSRLSFFDATGGGTKVTEPGYTYLISDILADNTARSEVFGPNSALKLSRTASVKTGTTDENRDAWTFGYTPQVVVGVWVGDTARAPMTLAGATGAAPIWNEIMETYLRGKPVETFKQPDTVSRLLVCRANGGLARAAGEGTYSEYFIKTQLPKNSCTPSPTPTPTPEATPTPEVTPTSDGNVVPTILLPATTPSPTPTPTLGADSGGRGGLPLGLSQR